MKKLHRPVARPPREIYPVHPWQLVERGFHPERVPSSETLFALANGHLGVRGTFEEGEPVHEHGTFINGFHETWPIVYPETAFGLASVGQTILGLPDATAICLIVEDEPVILTRGRLISHERVLDFRTGVLERSFEWKSLTGPRIRVRSRRLVSFEERGSIAFRLEVEVLSGRGRLGLSSLLLNRRGKEEAQHELDPRRAASLEGALEPLDWHSDEDRMSMLVRTRRSGMTAACVAVNAVGGSRPSTVARRSGQFECGVDFAFDVVEGDRLTLDKLAVYSTGGPAVASEAVLAEAHGAVSRAWDLGFDELMARQRAALDEFWMRSDVRIEGDDEAQQAVRWNLFHLAQATSCTDGEGVPAKGLTGRGYDGHYFWDTEVYVQPFLVATQPALVRELLSFRHRMLPAARRAAGLVSENGALFPWRTINGEEASAYYLAGTAQYHINADIAHALREYVEWTGDDGILREGGAEVLVETARMWAGLGFHSQTDGKFHIHGVTGPDEYTTIVDDNTYTNMMARENLAFAAAVVHQLESTDAQWFEAFRRRMELGAGEAISWQRAAAGMFIPFDSGRGVHPQDAHFLEKEVWSFASTPAENYPLLLHYHPLVIYRFQVLKQADVVLAMHLLPEEFIDTERRSNFLYYEPLTTGDSSLSHAIQSVVASEVGEQDLALQHFEHALFMDLANWAGNVDDGVHIASAGGVWTALFSGFAGVRRHGHSLQFNPSLPTRWRSLEFRLRFRDRLLGVRIERDALTLRLHGELPLLVVVQGKDLELLPGVERLVDMA